MTLQLPAPRLPDLVSDFLGQQAPSTRLAYSKSLAAFARHLGAADVSEAARTLLEAGPGAANQAGSDWVRAMREAGTAPATISARVSALRSLVKLGRRLGLVAWDLDVPVPKVVTMRDTSGPTPEEVARMLEVVRDSARDTAILRLLATLGLRRGELASLDLAHWDRAAGVLWIAGKGRNLQREAMTVPPRCAGALAAWVAERGDEPGPLFTSSRGARFGGGAVHELVRRVARKAGLRKVVRPHGLRHAAISRWLETSNGDVALASKLARHRDPAVTMVYADRLENRTGDLAARAEPE